MAGSEQWSGSGMTRTVKSCVRGALIMYLIVTLLTGCSTVQVRVEDPTEPIRLESTIVDVVHLQIDVPSKAFAPGPFYIWYDLQEYRQALESTLEQRLTSSKAVREVHTKEQSGKSVPVVRIIASFDGTVPWYKWVGRITIGVFSAFLLFIPMLFYSETNEARFGADVIVLSPSGKQFGPVRVQTAVEFDLALAKVGPDTWPTMMALGLEDLANKTVLELKRHPHWFEPAR